MVYFAPRSTATSIHKLSAWSGEGGVRGSLVSHHREMKKYQAQPMAHAFSNSYEDGTSNYHDDLCEPLESRPVLLNTVVKY